MKMQKTKVPKAPAGLSKAAAAFWRQVCLEYEFTVEALKYLEAGCQAFDRWQQARAEIDKSGLLYSDRFGQLRASAAVAIERDSRQSMVLCLKKLGLDVLPTGSRNGRGR
jgi:P27 family predicted phage terminase small subunit